MMDGRRVVHVCEYRVRYADTDAMQYMYNGQYLTLFEIGRTELLRSINLPYADLERAGFLLPLTEATIHYQRPALYDDLLSIETSYHALLSPTITLHYRILRGEELLASGRTVHCFIDATTRRAVRPPRLFSQVFDR